MPNYDGKLIEVKNLVVKLWGVTILVTGQIEILDIRKQVD